MSRPRPRAAAPAPPIDRLLAPFRAFAATESAGGVVLLAATALAMAWANSPWADAYRRLWQTSIPLGAWATRATLHAAIDDGLMTVFFFLVGLEIKRETVVGELARARRAALPMVAALGGMIVPATIYALVNRGGPATAGWGVPMATDIAFALGVLALLGDRVPTGLKVFLAALAIADDLGAVVVIAVFYSGGVSWGALAAAAAILAAVAALGRTGVRRPWTYAACGVALWGAVLASGVHATVAGVLLATAIPLRTPHDERDFVRLEQSLHGVVAFGIMPLFALANAGVSLDTPALRAAAASPATIGAALGLTIGKPLGIAGFAWLAIRLGIAAPPAGVSLRTLVGAGILGGIGFTMALFIAGLAFPDPARLDAAKVGVLGASLVAGVAGWLYLRAALRPRAAAR